jgi:hypothetical protein
LAGVGVERSRAQIWVARHRKVDVNAELRPESLAEPCCDELRERETAWTAADLIVTVAELAT